jgi:hypothetical protein
MKLAGAKILTSTRPQHIFPPIQQGAQLTTGAIRHQ